MRSTIATCLVCIVFCGLFPSGGAASPSGQARLLKVVALSHLGPHVPRIPHVSVQNENLPRWSEKPWPRWPAPAGSLPPRGARLVTAMWEDLRAHFFNLGLLPEEHCPSPFRVFARADATLTAQDTACAILDGLFPACGLPCAVSSRRPDPLFEPVRAGLDRFDPAQVAGGIMRAAGGNMDTLRDSHNAALTRIGQALGPLPARYCTRFNLPPDCALTSVPGMVSVAADGSDVSIGGGLEAGVVAAENFLQEYIQWPDSPAGWGQMDTPALREALALHSSVLNVVNRTPRVAQAKGGSLLAEMAAALAGEHTDPRCNAASLVIFVGNDSHLANVGALLGLFWRISGYPDNSVPPRRGAPAGTLGAGRPPRSAGKPLCPDAGNPARGLCLPALRRKGAGCFPPFPLCPHGRPPALARAGGGCGHRSPCARRRALQPGRFFRQSP